jgi:hypothetical protein
MRAFVHTSRFLSLATCCGVDRSPTQIELAMNAPNPGVTKSAGAAPGAPGVDFQRPAGAPGPGSSRSDMERDRRGSAGLRAVLRDDRIANANPTGALHQTRAWAHAFAVERPLPARRRFRHRRMNCGSEVECAITVGVGAKKLEKRSCCRMQRMRLAARALCCSVPERQVHTDLRDTRKGDAKRPGSGSVAQPSLPMQLVDGTRHTR